MISGVCSGEENLDFVESLRHSHIKLIVTRHEQTAGVLLVKLIGRLQFGPFILCRESIVSRHEKTASRLPVKLIGRLQSGLNIQW